MSRLRLPLADPFNGETLQAAFDQLLKWTNGKIGADNIQDGSIGTAELADGSVTGTKIADGTITNVDLLGGYPQLAVAQAVCDTDLTLTTSAQDLHNATLSLSGGTYLFLATFDFFHSVNGGDVAVGNLNIGGSDQGGQALLKNSGAANGDRATVAQLWYLTMVGTQTCKLTAYKTVNAGVVQALGTHSKLASLKIA
jgi:hypothetical protein